YARLGRSRRAPYKKECGPHLTDEQHEARNRNGRHRPLSAFNTFSAVIGNDLIRTPTASSTALAIAAAVGISAVSPMLMLLYGPLPKSDCRMAVLSSGISWMLGILYSPRLAASTFPLSS